MERLRSSPEKTARSESARRPIAVCDAGPLIALARIGRLDLLRQVFARALVPETVLRECLPRPDLPGTTAIRKALAAGSLDRIESPSEWRLKLPASLGDGERAVLELVSRQAGLALVDDSRARKAAQALGLPVVGIGGVLLAAKRRGVVPKVRPLLDRLQAEGYRISARLIAALIERAGENQPGP